MRIVDVAVAVVDVAAVVAAVVVVDVDVDVESSTGRGVLNAPVLAFWSFSNISCSSFGRRGGEGPRLKGEGGERRVVVVLRGRVRCRARGRGRRARRMVLRLGG